MATSLPSKEVYAVDVPEVKDFTAQFRYNFFTRDESTSEDGSVPISILSRHSSVVDDSCPRLATMRAPPFVEFRFTHPRLVNAGQVLSGTELRTHVLGRGPRNYALAENLEKIVSEDHFASNNFVAIKFHDS